MRGQARIEFILGIVVFTVIIFFIISYLNTVSISVASDSKLDTLKIKARNMIRYLVEDPGEPRDWWKDPDNAERIGLSTGVPYRLSLIKIDKINTTRDSMGNCILLDAFNPKGYRLRIYGSNRLLLFCGFEGETPLTAFVTENVYVNILGKGNITLEVW